MGKKLTEMSLEELWRLFPIYLTEHQSFWKEWYLEEKLILQNILPEIKRISHIGSTAVSSIWAKPIIDILVEIPLDCKMADYKGMLTDNGYICMSESSIRCSFNKGYTESGFAKKVFHIHLRYFGDNDELYFRDCLIDHGDIAKEYEKLKLSLSHEHQFNRDAYTFAKRDFVLKYTEMAKQEYGNKYQ